MSALTSKVGKGYIIGSTIISAVIIVLIVIVLLINSWDAITMTGWKLFSLKWNPSTNQFGMLSMLFGTFVVTFIALLLAVPLGIVTAIYISEVLPNK